MAKVIGGIVYDTEGSQGGMEIAENQAASTATTVTALKDDLNALLAKLKAAGIMTADTQA